MDALLLHLPARAWNIRRACFELLSLREPLRQRMSPLPHFPSATLPSYTDTKQMQGSPNLFSSILFQNAVGEGVAGK